MTKLVTLALIAVTATTAIAQSPDPFGKPKSDVGSFGVRLGLGLLLDSAAQDFAGTAHRAFGLSYFLPTKGPMGFNLSVDVDNVRHNEDGRRLDTTFFGLTARKPFGSLSKLQPYYGLSLGGAFVEARSATVTSRFQPAGQALIGVAVTDRVFLEAVYRAQGKIAGVTADTVTISLGARF